ncbi:hypothetical protein VTL71DRAFT_6757 [Oculimacula yallundae]|uniref:C2H2-type domain-containing protein n=1 Tax=Oculimacula yallundae TaxID=86028 RepID=A0ABR4BZE4_9HELO
MIATHQSQRLATFPPQATPTGTNMNVHTSASQQYGQVLASFSRQPFTAVRVDPVPVEDENGKFPCIRPSCNKKFESGASVIRHVHTVHDKARDYQCEVCGAVFSDKRRRITHLENPRINDGVCNREWRAGRVPGGPGYVAPFEAEAMRSTRVSANPTIGYPSASLAPPSRVYRNAPGVNMEARSIGNKQISTGASLQQMGQGGPRLPAESSANNFCQNIAPFTQLEQPHRTTPQNIRDRKGRISGGGTSNRVRPRSMTVNGLVSTHNAYDFHTPIGPAGCPKIEPWRNPGWEKRLDNELENPYAQFGHQLDISVLPTQRAAFVTQREPIVSTPKPTLSDQRHSRHTSGYVNVQRHPLYHFTNTQYVSPYGVVPQQVHASPVFLKAEATLVAGTSSQSNTSKLAQLSASAFKTDAGLSADVIENSGIESAVSKSEPAPVLNFRTLQSRFPEHAPFGGRRYQARRVATNSPWDEQKWLDSLQKDGIDDTWKKFAFER